MARTRKRKFWPFSVDLTTSGRPIWPKVPKGTSTGRDLSVDTKFNLVGLSVLEIWCVQEKRKFWSFSANLTTSDWPKVPQEGICETLIGPNRRKTSRGGVLFLAILTTCGLFN